MLISVCVGGCVWRYGVCVWLYTTLSCMQVHLSITIIDTEQFHHHRVSSCCPFVNIATSFCPLPSRLICFLFFISKILSFQKCYINGIIQSVIFLIGFYHFIIPERYIQVVVCINNLFFSLPSSVG